MAQGRALIVSTERSRGALAAARSLRRSGWEVGVGTPTGAGMLSSSRATGNAHRVPKPRGDSSGFVLALNRAISEGRYDIVFGGGDDWMAALSAYSDAIDAPVAHPPFPAVEAALDKLRLSALAGLAGLGAPETELATDAVIADWDGPVVVKCRSHWSPGTVAAHRIETKAYASIGAARERIALIRHAVGEAVLQRPVTGRLGAVIGVFHHGRLHGRVQQEANETWPVPNGVSTRATTVPVDGLLIAKCERLLGALGWEGLVELQFLTDSRGVPHLIDLNGRFFGSMALTEAARPGLPDLWARVKLGRATRGLQDAPAGHRFVWLAADLRRLAAQGPAGVARSALPTLRWAASATHSVWSLRDPAPTLRLVADRFSRRAQDAGDEEPVRASPGSSRLRVRAA